MIHVDTLCHVVERGALKFWEDVEKDREAVARVNKRSEKLLRPAQELPPTLP